MAGHGPMTTALLITGLVLFTAPLVLLLAAGVLSEARSILRDRRAGRGVFTTRQRPVLIDQRPPATIHSLEMHRRRRVNARRAQAAQRERAW